MIRAWPRLMAGTVERHGEAEVWAAGLEALGFPPTWVTTAEEWRRVVETLQRRQHHERDSKRDTDRNTH